MTATPMDELELDIRGQVCPSTLLTTLKEVNGNFDRLKAGILRMVIKTDARDATGTIPPMVKSMGFAVSVLKEQGYYQIVIAKERQV
ncbi:sulfurtransferase TusA family protein [Trichloromonas sp.]|uniref:sulfurtransferase TusA family protein n=1 Tax=Trichloromonas sp. TaxID=3069249 RepID=UPI002A4993BE|nr:sulfurtransferase TusA family protein [Trichloromonas sp.]